MARQRKFCQSPDEDRHLGRRSSSKLRIIGLIRELVRREVAAEFGRQRKIEDAVWANSFGNGAAAEPRKQQNRVMRLASARATLAILNERK